jgi:hypothetical protein
MTRSANSSFVIDCANADAHFFARIGEKTQRVCARGATGYTAIATKNPRKHNTAEYCSEKPHKYSSALLATETFSWVSFFL